MLKAACKLALAPLLDRERSAGSRRRGVGPGAGPADKAVYTGYARRAGGSCLLFSGGSLPVAVQSLLELSDLWKLRGDGEGSIYLWSGNAVAYVQGETLYGWDGRHLGWFVDGVIYDLQGRRVGFRRERSPVATYAEPAKYAKYAKYARYARQAQHARPALSMGLSDEDLEAFLRGGGIG